MSVNELAATADDEWPPAVEIVNEHGRSPIILVCEHASRYIPPEYATLGLPESEASRHIAWDIGAAEVTRAMAQLLDAAAFLGTYSRLLIDLNRPLHVPSSIVRRSEATDVPGNVELTPAERERRVRRIFNPFHERLLAEIEQREQARRSCILVAIHSFTPVYHGQIRQWHAGVLFERSVQLADSLIRHLGDGGTFNVGANVPYGVSAEDDYALLVHGDYRGHESVLIEIRHDLIAHPTGVREWANRLTVSLSQQRQVTEAIAQDARLTR